MTSLSLAMVLQLAANPACSVPGMVNEFWPAVIRVESHYDPLALHDDTANEPFYPSSAATAEELAIRLMQAGHSVGVGLSQLTARSPRQFERKFGITVREALDPCVNMKVGARFYVTGALSIYNAGNTTNGIAYAERVTASISDGAAPDPSRPPDCPQPDEDGWHTPAVPPRCLADPPQPTPEPENAASDQ